jgi:hypothetical protein
LTVRVPESTAPIPAARVALPPRRTPAARPVPTAPASIAPARAAELNALAARTDEALLNCRCAQAQAALNDLMQRPGGPARAAADHLGARAAACASPDVDERCVAGQVRPK